jgi:hypothetical protein
VGYCKALSRSGINSHLKFASSGDRLRAPSFFLDPDSEGTRIPSSDANTREVLGARTLELVIGYDGETRKYVVYAHEERVRYSMLRKKIDLWEEL